MTIGPHLSKDLWALAPGPARKGQKRGRRELLTRIGVTQLMAYIK